MLLKNLKAEQELRKFLANRNLRPFEKQLEEVGELLGVKIKLTRNGEPNLTYFAHQQRLKKIIQTVRNLPVKANKLVKKRKQRATMEDINNDNIERTTEQLGISEDDNIAITVRIPVNSFINQLLTRLKTV